MKNADKVAFKFIRLNRSKNYGCPTLAAYLFLRLGWDSQSIPVWQFQRPSAAIASAGKPTRNHSTTFSLPNRSINFAAYHPAA